MKNTTLIFTLVLTLLSCSTTSAYLYEQPVNDDASLVIGQATLDARNFPRYGMSSVSGIHHANIELTFLNVETQEEIVVVSKGEDGLFHFMADPMVSYKLVYLNYEKKNPSDGSMASVWLVPDAEIILDIQPGTVLDLGSFIWTTDNEARSWQIDQIPENSENRQLFKAVYPDSFWNDYAWVESEFHD